MSIEENGYGKSLPSVCSKCKAPLKERDMLLGLTACESCVGPAQHVCGRYCFGCPTKENTTPHYIPYGSYYGRMA
jgi:predicted amidophosphoribosyltransferase